MNPAATSLPRGVAPAPAQADAPVRPAPLSSVQLLRGQRLVEIAHNGEIYRLQATRQGKLILTK
ncbi:MAG TPA: hemin uptake protein HemP [Ramlibacter sp.]|uniref:hemin uptake protein HemP n=1 Tax=Ramlibacter sp. TaxID=1917967 RepID=UPI002D807B19|nr:hemin uptake protein HemP [Ramlibacter sp.]HET8748659.1 hemin uptake protein HemP [Ramlibacter sp.]